MKKRIISLFCAIATISGAFMLPAYSADNVNSQKLTNAENLLGILDISDSTFNSNTYSDTISRADFVLTASKIINVSGLNKSLDITYFNDVPLDFWGLREINQLVEEGALSLPEDRRFRPDEPILKTEAMKIILSLMKYDTYCQNNGGYPQGYVSTAYEYDLGDNLTSGDYMTYGDALMLIYNALEVPMMTIEYNGITLYEDETLLSYYFDAYSVEGKVTSAGGITIDGEVAYNGEIAIDGEKYYLENSDGIEYLGQTTKAYIKSESKDDIGTVFALEQISKKNEVIEIDISDVDEVDFSAYTIKYYKNNSNKTDTVNLDPGILVLKNGENISDDLSSAFDFDKGVIKLVDSDNDGYFDYAFNSAYRNIIVGYIDEDSRTVYDKIIDQNKISLEEYDEKVINIYKNGAKSNFAAITENSVLSVFDSSDYVRIDICTQSVSGTIFQKDEEDEIEILVGITDTESDMYTVTAEYAQYEGEKLKIGAKGTFYLDVYGKITYGEIGTDSAYTFAYVKKVAEDEDNDCLTLRIFDQAGTHQVLRCSEKLRVDGGALKDTATQKTVLSNYVGEVIRIKKSNDEIIEIDAALPVAESAEAQSFCKTGALEAQRYVYGQKRFGELTLHSDSTIFFVVPADVTDMSEELYGVVNRSFFISSKNYDIDSYKLSSSETFENVIVAKITGTPHIAAQTMFLVTDVSTVVGADDEVVTQVEGYYSGAKTSFVAAQTLDCTTFDEGDILMITAKDALGNVTGVKLRYDDDAENPTFDYTSDGLNSVSNNVYHNYHYMVGNIIDTSNGVISIGYDDIENIDVKMLSTATGTIICYDKDEKGENKFYKGSVKDLVPSNYANPECTKVVAWVKTGVIQWAVAYQPTEH